MQIRFATPDDATALADLRWEHEYEQERTVADAGLRDEFIKSCAAFLADGLRDGSWVCWLAEDSGVVAANIFIRRIRKVPKPQKPVAEIGYVTNVHTRTSYRNKGLGSELMKQVVAWAREAGLEGLFVWPSQRSRSFYQRQGFTGENDVMELELG